eukprot:CAMPEP_0173294930 /NCGR_PEP_ID=MMETSP1143-20121109/14158_1 /TAXON_ID=483371 /ORGANISM="non described non described, Strain CCMP2298" /LENGTH=147 /DNA_ID=CAMNT_0014234685 /DNA_START=1754 /DNA_END=2197 /DNA_ORIENTATION=-
MPVLSSVRPRSHSLLAPRAASRVSSWNAHVLQSRAVVVWRSSSRLESPAPSTAYWQRRRSAACVFLLKKRRAAPQLSGTSSFSTVWTTKTTNVVSASAWMDLKADAGLISTLVGMPSLMLWKTRWERERSSLSIDTTTTLLTMLVGC